MTTAIVSGKRDLDTVEKGAKEVERIALEMLELVRTMRRK